MLVWLDFVKGTPVFLNKCATDAWAEAWCEQAACLPD